MCLVVTSPLDIQLKGYTIRISWKVDSLKLKLSSPQGARSFVKKGKSDIVPLGTSALIFNSISMIGQSPNLSTRMIN